MENVLTQTELTLSPRRKLKPKEFEEKAFRGTSDYHFPPHVLFRSYATILAKDCVVP
jgi:hypothetical protein